MPPHGAAKAQARSKTKHASVFSFFTGAGFLDLGFQDAGFEVVFANEYSPEFARAYAFAQNRVGHKPPRHGVRVCSIEDLLRGGDAKQLSIYVDTERARGRMVGFIGGPPCPDFSVGGKNRGALGENGRLTRVYFDLIAKQQPDWFLFENVKGLVKTRLHREFFGEMRSDIQAAGYLTAERLVNAIEYGAPQDRDRIIMVGISRKLARALDLDGISELPETAIDWRGQMPFTRDILKDAAWPTTNRIGLRTTRPAGVPAELTVEHWFRRNCVSAHPNAKHAFRPRAGLRRFLTVLEGDDSRKSYKRLHRHRYSPTACYGNNEVHVHPSKPRRISVAEALAVQSVPRKFALPDDMSLSAMFKTVGNGVPYLAARGLAATVAQTLARK